MDDYYVDNWGELQTKKNLSDWSDFEPWQFWQTQYEWIECDDDYEEQDIIAFRDDVVINNRDKSRTFRDGVRFHICRVANIQYDKAYLEVIHSEGEKPFAHGEHIYRSQKWLSRYGVQRWPRDRSPTERVSPELKEKGMILKEERKSLPEVSKGSSKSESRFFTPSSIRKRPPPKP